MIVASIVRTLITDVVLVIITIISATAVIIIGVFNPYAPVINGIIRIWAGTIIWFSGIRLQVEGREHIHESRPYVFMANHLSTFDILVLVKILPGTVRFIAKKELFRIPLFSQGMTAVGMIKIDRGNSEQARKTISNAVKVLQSGVSIIIFPEGTRSRDGQIQAFKKGGFILALNAGIPIVPVIISGSQHVMRKNSYIFRPGKIKIQILEPMPTDGMKLDDRNELLSRVHGLFLSHFDPAYNQPHA